MPKPTLAPDSQLKAEGYEPHQILYLRAAQRLVLLKKATTPTDLQEQLGYGIIDEPVLKATFFQED